MIKLEYRELMSQMLDTFMAARHGQYPQSHSDLEVCLGSLIKMFEIKRRPIALDRLHMTEEEYDAEERAEYARRGVNVESLGKNGYKMVITVIGCRGTCHFGNCSCK